MSNWLSTGIATAGQVLGLPEMNISERIAGSNTQTTPAAGIGSNGVLGNSGYVVSPVPGNAQNYPVSGGVAQSGPQQGQTVLSNPIISGGGGGSWTSNTQQTQQSSGGGGGGNNGGIRTNEDAIRAGYTGLNDYNDQMQRRAEQQRALDYANNPINVDREWEPVLSNYDSMRNNAMAGKTDFMNQYTQPIDAMRPGIEQGYQEGVGMIGQQRNQVQSQTENALAAARRLYQELTQGIQQRFGGSNSAGEFAKEFQGRGYQEQMGNVRNTEGQNMQALNQKSQDLQGQYQAQLQSLEQQKTAALSKAQDTFNQRIQAIDDARGQAMAAKASSKLQELQTFRGLAAQIQQNAQNQQFALQQQMVAGQQSLQQAIAQYQLNAGKMPTMQNTSQWNPSQVGGGQAYNPYTTNVTGQTGGNKYDEYGRLKA
jgi:hypothetical protein